MWTVGAGQLTDSIAHMMLTWKLHIKDGDKDTKLGLPDSYTSGKKRKPNKMSALRSKHSRGCVPSAPCRGREHGREMVWIIIGQESTHSMTLREGGRLREQTGW